jgi:hypothetical protein
MLEDHLNLIQDTIKLDSTRWEIKHGTIYEEEISNIIIQNEPDQTRNRICDSVTVEGTSLSLNFSSSFNSSNGSDIVIFSAESNLAALKPSFVE